MRITVTRLLVAGLVIMLVAAGSFVSMIGREYRDRDDSLVKAMDRLKSEHGQQAQQIHELEVRLQQALDREQSSKALLSSLQADLQNQMQNQQRICNNSQAVDRPHTTTVYPTKTPHRLGVIVPFRKADQELVEFLPHMKKFLEAQGIEHHFLIINQIDNYRFNRGELLNIGFLKAVEEECDYIVMHDVDLLPLLPKQLSYAYPEQPMHIATPWIHPNYHYPKFIGGILIMTNTHFANVNGLSNNYWGWGREDDELYKRITEMNLNITRPDVNETRDGKALRHMHDQDKRVRDMMQIGNQFKIANERDRSTGLDNVDYELASVRRVFIQNVSVAFYDVRLRCNTAVTPWCEHPKKCLPGYYRHKASGACQRCANRCWRGFVLVGKCSEEENPRCLKVGRDISEEEAKKYPKGDIRPPPGAA
eukprot:m.76670 g.76670  ORF g.76670 m.76670 type:complete len:421 (-) comp14652_c0_seq2:368-1630(-)